MAQATQSISKTSKIIYILRGLNANGAEFFYTGRALHGFWFVAVEQTQ
jgi:hypothetical protein